MVVSAPRSLAHMNRREKAWRTRIDRKGLTEFVAREVEVVEAGWTPESLADLGEPGLRHEAVSREELWALWLAAGLATHVGLAIFEEPERFLTRNEPSPPRPATLVA
jgi:hypothetical protein